MKNVIIVFLVTLFLILATIYFYPITLKKPSGFCAQVITKACHTITGECREFSNPCNLPYFWEKK
jgi:hypothetical protein